MVAHEVHGVVDVEFVVGFDPEGEAFGGGVAHGVFFIALHAGGNAVEHGVDAGVAAAEAAEGQRGVGVAEGEVGVGAVVPAAGAGVGDDVGAVDAFDLGLVDVVEVEAGDGGGLCLWLS